VGFLFVIDVKIVETYEPKDPRSPNLVKKFANVTFILAKEKNKKIKGTVL
jgi:hypothetical protein